MSYGRIDLTRYVVVPIWYGCNNNCTICMLSRVKKHVSAMGFDGFQRLLADIVKDGRFKGLILSGAEVTTFDELEDYIRYAASLGWFERIQIQSNGRRLRDRRYAARLVAAGLNELFVSVHGPEEIHDAITRSPGSFRQTMEGLGALADFDVNVITNTVLTKVNFDAAAGLLMRLSELAVGELHLWNFYPMEATDRRDLAVSMRDFAGLLPKLLAAVAPSGKPLVLKSFPECLAVGAPGFFDSGYPVTVLPNRFWEEFDKNRFGTCPHKESCRAKACWGLSAAYIEKYGEERDLLRPFLGEARPTPARGEGGPTT